MNSQFIQDLRKEIDAIDTQLLQFLGKRMQHATLIGSYKKEKNIPVVQGNRWQLMLLEAVTKGEKEGLNPEFVKKIWNTIHDESVRIQEHIVKN